MKLGILQINGADFDPVGSYPDGISGAPFILAETLPAGYRDITTISGIYSKIGVLPQDFKFCRDAIKEIVTGQGGGDTDAGFDTLSDEEKAICAGLLIGSHAKRYSFVNNHSLMVQYSLGYHLNARESRKARFAYAIQELYNRLPDNAKGYIYETREAVSDFLLYGIEGTEEGDPPGLLDAIYGRTGTPWEGAGLIHKTWTPLGVSITDLVTSIYNILHKGLY